jgi:FkbM family methyltransferase
MSVVAAFDRLLEACGDLNFVDVGARWGVHPRFAIGKAHVICFEPDVVECTRLAQNAPSNVRYLPYGLADQAGPQTLYMTKEPACSSIYAPVTNLYRYYPQLSCIEPVRTVEIQCQTYDEVARVEKIGPVTAMKLDTQGSELAILRGATVALKNCALIDIEVEFNPIYSGQSLFCDVDRFLRDQGFVLWHLENLVH